MAVLEFDGYRVLELAYSKNLSFKNDENNLSFNPKFSVEFKVISDKDASVVLGFTTKEELPFDITVKIEGDFVYENGEDDKNIGFDSLLKKNATAILFPYLRMIVSQITGIDDEFPMLVLPTMNIEKFIEDREKGR
ncbi:MAG: protein-export chaperone SecB [Anaeroplasmataceae bacterium]|nr:protein-export chaperone SecB [Anaeroplasmataceae bacterium]